MSGASSSSRRRAALFGLLALLCAALSAAGIARRDEAVTDELGEMREVVVVERPIARGTKLQPDLATRSLGLREVPLRFLPPDRLEDFSLAFGARAVADIPAGSYLLASLLRSGSGSGGPAAEAGGAALAEGLRPVEVEVSGGSGGVGGVPVSGTRVDVLAADEPGSTTNPRVHVLARDVPLLGIEAVARDELDSDPDTGGWLATLALGRRDSLAVIEADNYAREVRLLER